MKGKKKRPENPLAFIGVPGSVTKRWEEITPTLKTDENTGEILLYGPIVDQMWAELIEEWYGEGVVISAKQFRDKMAAIEGNILIRCNCPGGDVWEADGIMNAIVERRNAGDEVNLVIDGLAASAATLIMMRTQNIKAGKMSSVMIHESSLMIYGNKRELRDAAELLEGIDKQGISLYAERLDKDEKEIMSLLEEETWYTADEAVEAGLVDEIVDLDDRKKEPSAKMSAEEEAALEEKKKSFFDQRQLRLAALAA